MDAGITGQQLSLGEESKRLTPSRSFLASVLALLSCDACRCASSRYARTLTAEPPPPPLCSMIADCIYACMHA